MIDLFLGPPDLSPALDCITGLAIVVSVGCAAWTIWRHREL